MHGPVDDRATGFGAQLRRYREGAGLTQEALAERAGLAPSAVAALERGRRRRPHPHTVRQLAAALQLDAARRARFEAAGRRAGAPPPEEGTEEGAGGRAGSGREGTLEAAPPTPTNLPAPRAALIGRDGEVGAVVELLTQAGARLVTLTGVGGVGKTRVALQAAWNLRGAFPAGVWLVELAPIADPALVPNAVAAALGVGEAPGRAVLDGLAAALRPQAPLLVLDNCEHVVDASARLAERLLDACPGLRWTALESVETRALGARAFSRVWITPRGRRPGGPVLSSFL
jgi:transcriptional regulator with XRE-family HTH domain